MPAPARLSVGPWLADPAANELVRDGDAVRIEPKMMEVLMVLAEQPGETVSRDALLERIWPGVIVTEDALSGTISKLRRVLGDDARTPTYIETIPRTGYRLVAPVRRAEARSTAPPQSFPMARSAAPWRVPLIVLGTAILLATVFALDRRTSPEAALYAVRPLTRAAGIERDPAFDPAGQRLAFTARARDSSFYHLFVQSLGAETPLQLTDARADDRWPTWSPDGRTLAFLRCLGLRCHVYTAPVPGGTPRRRAEASVAPYGLAWVPSGDAVLIVDRDTTTSPYRLLRLDLATGARRALTTPPASALGDLAPTTGPDGTVAFLRHGTSGGEDVYLLSTDDEAPRRLTAEEGRIRGIAWEADGSGLLFSSRREGTISLWRVPAAGGPVARTDAPGVRDPGGLALRAGHTVVESWAVEVHLWEAIRHGEAFATQPLVVGASAHREPALSPDGTRLAFVADRSGTPELWVAWRDGSEPLRLTDFGGMGLGAPAWLPDSERLVFEGQREGQAAIYIVAADGGTPEPITDAAGYDVTPRPSRDGRWVYFGSDRTGSWEVWKVAIDGSTLIRVTDAGGFASQESPDGETLYFTRYFEPGLWAMPTTGAAARLVTDQIGALDWGNWTVTEEGLFWVDRSATEARVQHLDLVTGAVSTAFAAPDVPVREVGLTATPDGRTLVVARTARVESDLLLITSATD